MGACKHSPSLITPTLVHNICSFAQRVVHSKTCSHTVAHAISTAPSYHCIPEWHPRVSNRSSIHPECADPLSRCHRTHAHARFAWHAERPLHHATNRHLHISHSSRTACVQTMWTLSKHHADNHSRCHYTGQFYRQRAASNVFHFEIKYTLVAEMLG